MGKETTISKIKKAIGANGGFVLCAAFGSPFVKSVVKYNLDLENERLMELDRETRSLHNKHKNNIKTTYFAFPKRK